MLFDTHAHLNDEQYEADFDETIDRAAAAGVGRILIAAYDEESSRRALELSRKREGLYCSLGVHPHDAKSYHAGTGDLFRQLARENGDKVLAIGEIGLDYHYDLSPREAQREAFEAQIRLATECGLPFIVHDREAHQDVLQIIEKCAGEGLLRSMPGILHCYSGSVEMAQILLKMGFYLSFAGPVTFRNARKTLEVMAEVPMDRILIETDCPYLSPEPLRGRRNEPANVGLVASKLADVKGITLQEAQAVTYGNACRIFHIRDNSLDPVV